MLSSPMLIKKNKEEKKASKIKESKIVKPEAIINNTIKSENLVDVGNEKDITGILEVNNDIVTDIKIADSTQIKLEHGLFVKPEQKEEFVERDNIGSPIFTDDFFKDIKLCLNDLECLRKGIKSIQTGYRMILYQGTKSNIWGILESRPGMEKPFIKIHNSMLLRILKKHKATETYFKEIL
jgi:hypothetical protein